MSRQQTEEKSANRLNYDSDIKLLTAILSYRRPHRSRGEDEFIRHYIDPVSSYTDDMGNHYAKVNDAPILWSCHLDTVHHDRGGTRQLIALEMIDGQCFAELHKSARKAGNCLGGDNGAGVFMLLSMIAANVPGTYVFHRGEEQGCIGSGWIAKNRPEFLEQFNFAIAFDRMGESEIITHQCGLRTASDKFANALALQLKSFDASLKLSPSDLGMYTDTNEYAHIIPECTNLSCGYENNHGPREILNVSYLLRLKRALCSIDVSRLVVSRDPDAPDDYRSRYQWRGGWMDSDDRFETTRDASELSRLVQLCREFPDAAAELLCQYGVDPSELLEVIEQVEGYLPSQFLS